MKKIINGLLAMSSIPAFAADYSIECYAKVKCPEGSNCAISELLVDVVDNQAMSVTAKSSRRTNEVTNFKTSIDGMVKISGKDAYGDTFSARFDLEKVSETEEYSIAGKYNILRFYPVNLACRKL